jgi:hypothetical protein
VQFGDSEEAVVVRDGANDADGFVFVRFLRGLRGDFTGDAGDGHWGAVDAGHEEAAEDDFVEVRVCAAYTAVRICFVGVFGLVEGHTGEEAVQLHEEFEVDIVALGSFSVSVPDVVAV